MSAIAAPHAPSGARGSWIARNNHRYRSASFFMICVALVVDRWGDEAPLTWLFLGVLCLVVPHLAYLRARRAADPAAAELNNLVIDSLAWGVLMPLLGFPLWPMGVIWVTALMNSAFCGGARSLAKSVAAMLAGAAITTALFGFDFRPHTDWPAVVILAATFTLYILAIGLVAHQRYEQLRTARERMRLSEQALAQRLEEIQELQELLSEQAIRDPLTGLFNRRYLDTIIPHEIARRDRDGSELALLMIDIDHFKLINDRFGHQGGDKVLEALGALLNGTVRGSDVACRFGGEEFLLLLPGMPTHRAVARAEEWRRAFAALSVESGDSLMQATLSIGVAVCPGDGASMDELIGAADRALYDAKARGRDRVVLAGGPQLQRNDPASRAAQSSKDVAGRPRARCTPSDTSAS